MAEKQVTAALNTSGEVAQVSLRRWQCDIIVQIRVNGQGACQSWSLSDVSITCSEVTKICLYCKAFYLAANLSTVFRGRGSVIKAPVWYKMATSLQSIMQQTHLLSVSSVKARDMCQLLGRRESRNDLCKRRDATCEKCHVFLPEIRTRVRNIHMLSDIVTINAARLISFWNWNKYSLSGNLLAVCGVCNLWHRIAYYSEKRLTRISPYGSAGMMCDFPAIC